MSTYVVRPTPEIWHQPGYIILEMDGDRVVRNVEGIWPTEALAELAVEQFQTGAWS